MLASTALFAQPTETTKPAPAAKPATTTGEPDGKTPKDAKPAAADPYVLGYSVKDIDGKDQKLDQFKGKVVLIVNVASNCGFTGQYAGLEKLYQDYKSKGLVVIGFPANDFNGQEPGSDSEIKQFCTSKYNVTFPMFSKIHVVGADAHPLYKQLAAQKGEAGGEPKWNFNKYLVDREGKVVEHFQSQAKPDSDQLRKKIEALLGAGSEKKPAPAPDKK